MIQYLFFLLMLMMDDQMKSEISIPFPILHLVLSNNQVYEYKNYIAESYNKNSSINDITYFVFFANSTHMIECYHDYSSFFEGIFSCQYADSSTDQIAYYVNFDQKLLRMIPIGNVNSTKLIDCYLYYDSCLSAIFVISFVMFCSLIVLGTTFIMKFPYSWFCGRTKQFNAKSELTQDSFDILEFAIFKNQLDIVKDFESNWIKKHRKGISTLYEHFDGKHVKILHQLSDNQQYSMLKHLMTIPVFFRKMKEIEMGQDHPLFIAVKNKDIYLLVLVATHFDKTDLEKVFVINNQHHTLLTFALCQTKINLQVIEKLVLFVKK